MDFSISKLRIQCLNLLLNVRECIKFEKSEQLDVLDANVARSFQDFMLTGNFFNDIRSQRPAGDF